QKDEWTEEETNQIREYLNSDVQSTKQMFDKLWIYWYPFAELVDEKYVYDLSWIKSSIASLTYKAACRVLGTEPTYSETSVSLAEEMGGRVIEPTVEEAIGVWHVDFASLYPHIESIFNLPAEISEDKITPDMKIFHKNNLFEAKGYYNITEQHPLSKYIVSKLKERIHLKNTDKNNPMIYTLKILLNGLYGIFRSPKFEKIHTPNIGWDTCFLGQQIHQLMEEMMKQFGFIQLAGDTDSGFFKAREEQFNNREYVTQCLKEIISIINENVPFPTETFQITIEHYLEYIMFPFSNEPVIDAETGENKKVNNRLIKERKAKKKNYLYIYKEDNKFIVKLVGLPIIKDNATELGIKIYNEVIEVEIIKKNNAKFPKTYIDTIINDYLKNPDTLKLLSQEYKVQAFNTYKKEGQIQAQISKAYLDGLGGTIRLIKNSKVGKVGKGSKYCTIEESLTNNLSVEDYDLEKVYNELEPFIIYEEPIPEVKTEEQPKKKRGPKAKTILT
ncbi:MAG: hypothetical protein AABY22_18880, partial [Nanoarchaeota archaeon]